MKELVNLFYEIGTLRKIKRSYHINVLQDTESVAEHSHRAMLISYFLAKKVGADPYKCILMASLHDLAEARTGDSNWVQKSYITQDEDKATEEQLLPLRDLSKDLFRLLSEYKERKTLESQVTKDADNIEYVLSLRELELTGNKEATRRLNSENTFLDKLFTEEAKAIVILIKKTGPTEWTQKDLRISHKSYKEFAKSKKSPKR
ncbi:MAG: HD domain-containing protein [Patescibacteria group bacterium]